MQSSQARFLCFLTKRPDRWVNLCKQYYFTQGKLRTESTAKKVFFSLTTDLLLMRLIGNV